MYEPQSSEEREYYDELFRIATAGAAGESEVELLTGNDAVVFLSKSGLDRTILRECWQIAITSHSSEDLQRRSGMTKPEFYILMRLVALAQNELSTSTEPGKKGVITKQMLQDSVQNPNIPLPQFKNISVGNKQAHHEVQGFEAQPIVTQSGVVPRGSNVSSSSSSLVSSAAQNTEILAAASSNRAPTLEKRYSSSSSSLGSTQRSWAMSSTEKEYYTKVFHQQPVENGLLNGKAAAAFLAKSRVEQEKLREIWNLSDVDKDGALTVDEFCIAMHLCICISKHGFTLPKTLPPELLSQIERPQVPSMTIDNTSKTSQEAARPPAFTASSSSRMQTSVAPPFPATSGATPSEQPQQFQHSESQQRIVQKIMNLTSSESVSIAQGGPPSQLVEDATKTNTILENVQTQLEKAVQRAQSEKSKVLHELNTLQTRRNELLESLEEKERILKDETIKISELDEQLRSLRKEVSEMESRVLNMRENTVKLKEERVEKMQEKVSENGGPYMPIPKQNHPALTNHPPPNRPAPRLEAKELENKAKTPQVEDPWATLDTGGTENDWNNFNPTTDDLSRDFDDDPFPSHHTK